MSMSSVLLKQEHAQTRSFRLRVFLGGPYRWFKLGKVHEGHSTAQLARLD